jgi:hypothetical protein
MGIVGAVILAKILEWTYGISPTFDEAVLIELGGYAFGSVVVGIWIEEAKAAAAANRVEVIPPEPAPRALPAPSTPPFRFAEWEDGDPK